MKIFLLSLNNHQLKSVQVMAKYARISVAHSAVDETEDYSGLIS